MCWKVLKNNPRSEEHIFVDCCNETKGYHLCNKNYRHIIRNRDVIDEFEDNLPTNFERELIFPFKT